MRANFRISCAYFFGEYLDNGYRPRTPHEVKELPPIENTLAIGSSLADHLSWQLSVQTHDELLWTIGTAIIGNLDDDGYFRASIDEIAAMGNWPEADVERVLSLVHAFDPIGVAARDLQECLLLQLRHLGLEKTPSEVIVRDHLRLLENHQLPELARQLDLPIDEAQGPHCHHPSSRPETRGLVQPFTVPVRHPRCVCAEDRRRVCGRSQR